MLTIRLDEPGPDGKPVPHWLSYWRRLRRLRVIIGRARQLRLRIRDRPRILRIVK